MSAPLLLKTHRGLARPRFDRIALVLQGGGALGAYQAGVYQALDEAGLAMDWVAGVSIGAINAALIVGNPPEQRAQKLKAFWDEVSTETPAMASLDMFARSFADGEAARIWLNHMSAFSAVTMGAPGLFTPRLAPPWTWPEGSANATSFFDTAPLRTSLERFVDFDRINSGKPRLSVGAVNVRTGNFAYFDTTTHVIGPEHILASAALPPYLPAVEIDGELYWDGGIVSNTPLDWIVECEPHEDTLVFQVDLWNTRGDAPQDIADVVTRQKEIQFASRTRASTSAFRRLQLLKNAASELLVKVSGEVTETDEFRTLQREVDRAVFRIVHLIYHAKPHHGSTKDFEFARRNMEEHWATGYDDAVRTLHHPEALERPKDEILEGVATFDVAVDGRM